VSGVAGIQPDGSDVTEAIAESIVIQVNADICLHCRREWLLPKGADAVTLSPLYHRWIIEHPAGQSHIGPQVVPGQSRDEIERLLLEWWRVSSALGRF
jgi:hypothetical protein